jgi:toxin CcdB
MAQFDVHRNADPASRRRVPYILDVQTDILDNTLRRLVVPLVAASELKVTIKRLHPAFELEGRRVVMSTLEIANVPRHILGDPVSSLSAHRVDIIAAIDFAITGI